MREIVLSGPGKNALNTPLMTRVIAELKDAGDEPVLLSGAGGAFSAGLDLKEVASLDAAGMRAFLNTLDELCRRLWTHPAPTVALIEGHAIAGGCVLALACDFRVITDSPAVRIGLNEVAIGLRFPPLVLRIANHVIPSHMRAEVLLGAGLFDPATALRLGVVDAVERDARAAATAKLQKLAASPRSAYAATKFDLKGDGSVSAEEIARFERDVLPVWTSDALRQRLLAMLKPKA